MGPTRRDSEAIRLFAREAQVDNDVGNVSSECVRDMVNKEEKLEGALSDGSPCLRHRCVACCLETEMPLTIADIERIEKLGFKRAEFTVEVDDETHLKNKQRRCFFLYEGVCRVYSSRPDGCRIYPLVYDVDARRFVFDSVCPNTAEFKTTKEDKEHLKHLIHKLDREAAKKV